MTTTYRYIVIDAAGHAVEGFSSIGTAKETWGSDTYALDDLERIVRYEPFNWPDDE